MNLSEHRLKIAVVGLGNELMADDGLGVHVIRALQAAPQGLRDVQLVEVGTAVLHFQDLFEQSDIVIAVDAIATEGPAGRLVCFDGADALLPAADSLHSLGVPGVLRLIPPDRRPRLVLIGAQPERVEYGTDLSATLKAAMPQLVRAVRELIEKIRQSDTPDTLEELFSIRT